MAECDLDELFVICACDRKLPEQHRAEVMEVGAGQRSDIVGSQKSFCVGSLSRRYEIVPVVEFVRDTRRHQEIDTVGLAVRVRIEPLQFQFELLWLDATAEDTEPASAGHRSDHIPA